MSQLAAYDVWVAQYASKCTYPGSYGMWQYGVIGCCGVKGRDYTIDGAVSGVNANCDVNVVYRDYPGLAKGVGLNGWGKTGAPGKDADAPPDYKALYEAERAKLEEVQGGTGGADGKTLITRQNRQGLNPADFVVLLKFVNSSKNSSNTCKDGAADRDRTGTVFLPRDFKSFKPLKL